VEPTLEFGPKLRSLLTGKYRQPGLVGGYCSAPILGRIAAKPILVRCAERHLGTGLFSRLTKGDTHLQRRLVAGYCPFEVLGTVTLDPDGVDLAKILLQLRPCQRLALPVRALHFLGALVARQCLLQIRCTIAHVPGAVRIPERLLCRGPLQRRGFRCPYLQRRG
jgi:hypothetical protein